MVIKMPPKSKKSGSPWVLCEDCSSYMVEKDANNHSSSCPPDLANINYPFIHNSKLYGTVDVKSNEDIKGLSPQQKENMVFVSQSVFQLCSLAIGEWAIVKSEDSNAPPIAKIVWPTAEKSLTSILFTKKGLESVEIVTGKYASITKVCGKVRAAELITVVLLNGPKNLQITPELQNRLRKTYLDSFIHIDNKISLMFYGKVLKFQIKSIKPSDTLFDASGGDNVEESFAEMSLDVSDFYKVGEKTRWKLFGNDEEFRKETESKDLLKSIGGLDDEIQEIEDLMNATLFNSSKLQVSRGVLLYGSSGTGKTIVAKALAKKSGVNIVNICAPDLYAKFEGKIEEIIKNLFADAIKQAPSIIILDEVDVLCPSRSNRMTETDKRIVSSLLVLLDDLNEMENCKVFILATTNKPDAIDPAFRRCGRFDREIEIPIPNPKSRLEILKRLLVDVPNEINDEDLREFANAGHGFVGADLVSLCSQASLHATKGKRSCILLEDFKFALTKVRPSAMREVQIEVPNVKWSDIGGQDYLKLILRQAVEWPLKHADKFVKMGITPPRGVLMFGPPGCSKTMIAKALATESGLNFLSIKGPEIFSKWVGESERAVREVFRKARQVAPSIVFFDEIDAIGGERTSGSNSNVQERVLAQLLTELDGVTPLGDVTILAATNRPDKMDKALLRPGRLDRIVYVPLPSEDTRRAIFTLKFSKMPVIDVDVGQLVAATQGYSGAEISAVCHEAAMMALEENIEAETIEKRHFEAALRLITPRTPPSLLKIYEDYLQNKD